MKRRDAVRPLLLGLLLAALASPAGAGSELWRWIDAEGVARYTPDPEQVPAARRATLVRVEAGMPAAPPPATPHAAESAPEGAKPPAIFAPPGDPTLAQDPWNAPERARAVEGERVEDSGEIVIEVPTTPPVAPPPAPSAPPEPAPPSSALPEAALPAVAAAAPPASPPAAAPPEPPPLPAEREARRAELVAAIARDEEALKAHVSSAGADSLVASPELREIAERLPALQAELRALEAPSASP